MNNCKKCNEPVEWDYCPKCGQPVQLKRIDRQYVIREIGDFFFATKGMVYTINRVLISPGKSVKQFLTEDRHRFVKPITFVIITSLFYSIINYFFKIEVENLVIKSSIIDISIGGIDVYGIEIIFRWMAENYAYSLILTGLLMAFWLKIFFKKYGYNLFEIFILLCFISGISTLVLSVGVILQWFTQIEIINKIAGLYMIWAVGHFFDKKKVASYAKTLLSFILGNIVFAACSVGVGFLIDLIIK
jgi:hypothetical protein